MPQMVSLQGVNSPSPIGIKKKRHPDWKVLECKKLPPSTLLAKIYLDLGVVKLKICTTTKSDNLKWLPPPIITCLLSSKTCNPWLWLNTRLSSELHRSESCFPNLTNQCGGSIMRVAIATTFHHDLVIQHRPHLHKLRGQWQKYALHLHNRHNTNTSFRQHGTTEHGLVGIGKVFQGVCCASMDLKPPFRPLCQLFMASQPTPPNVYPSKK